MPRRPSTAPPQSRLLLSHCSRTSRLWASPAAPWDSRMRPSERSTPSVRSREFRLWVWRLLAGSWRALDNSPAPSHSPRHACKRTALTSCLAPPPAAVAACRRLTHVGLLLCVLLQRGAPPVWLAGEEEGLPAACQGLPQEGSHDQGEKLGCCRYCRCRCRAAFEPPAGCSRLPLDPSLDQQPGVCWPCACPDWR